MALFTVVTLYVLWAGSHPYDGRSGYSPLAKRIFRRGTLDSIRCSTIKRMAQAVRAEEAERGRESLGPLATWGEGGRRADVRGCEQERRPSDRISAAAALNSKWFRDEGLLDTFAAGVDDALLGGGSEWQSWLLNNMAKNGEYRPSKPGLAYAPHSNARR